jgi:hypothetical protein
LVLSRNPPPPPPVDVTKAVKGEAVKAIDELPPIKADAALLFPPGPPPPIVTVYEVPAVTDAVPVK